MRDYINNNQSLADLLDILIDQPVPKLQRAMKDQIRKSLGENFADLESLKQQRSGKIPTLLSNFRLDELIKTKQDNIERLKKLLKRKNGKTTK